MGLIQTIEADIEAVIHRTRTAVQNAVVEAEKVAAAEEAKIATDVRAAVADAEAVLKADAPEIEAALKNGAAAVLQAVEAALAAHGL